MNRVYLDGSGSRNTALDMLTFNSGGLIVGQDPLGSGFDPNTL